MPPLKSNISSNTLTINAEGQIEGGLPGFFEADWETLEEYLGALAKDTGYMEIALDKFIVRWFLSENDKETLTAATILQLVIRKCHRLVFDREYFDHLRRRLKAIINRRRDTYVQIFVRRLISLLSDTQKVRKCEGHAVSELTQIDPDDTAIVKSALCISDKDKILVSTDQNLIEKLEEQFKQYGIKAVTPEKAIELLE